jgi:C4-dicarboxylate transporter
MEENTRTEVDLTYKQTLSGVFVLMFITGFLFVAGWIISPNTDFNVNEKLSYLLIALIILFSALIVFLRKHFFSWGYIREKFDRNEKTSVLKLLHNNTLLLGIINVLITFLGFILALLEGNKFQILKISVISLILFIIIFPHKSNWKKIYNSLEN